MREAGLSVRRAELISETVNLPEDLSDEVPLTDLLTSGVKLLAVRSLSCQSFLTTRPLYRPTT